MDRWLPRYDVHERHSRGLSVEPAPALAALLETPVGCDTLTRALLALRGLGGGGVPIGRFFETLGFSVLEQTETLLVVGASGRPWRVRGALR